MEIKNILVASAIVIVWSGRTLAAGSSSLDSEVDQNGLSTHVIDTLSGQTPNPTVDSYRYEIARMGINSHHWASTSPIFVECWQVYPYTDNYVKFRVSAGYSDFDGSVTVEERIGSNNSIDINIGTPVLTGDSSSDGHPNQYVPVYIDLGYYANWSIRLTHGWTTTETDIPERNRLKVFASPNSSLLAGIIPSPTGEDRLGSRRLFAGQLGIGTVAPSEELHVVGDATVEGDLAVTGALDVSTLYADHLGSTGGVVAEGANAGLWTGSRTAPHGTDVNSFRIVKNGIRTDFIDRNDGTDKRAIRFLGNGKVGLGPLFDPQENLSIYGGGGADYEVNFGLGPADSRKWVFRAPAYNAFPELGIYPLILEHKAGGHTGDFVIRGRDSEFAFKSHGAFGVGIEDPKGFMHVKSGSSGYDPVNVPTLLLENGGSSQSHYVFQTLTNGGGQSVSITNSGKVGIGTTDPKYHLTVAGRLNSEANGDYYGAWFGGEARENNPSFNLGSWYNNKVEFMFDDSYDGLKVKTVDSGIEYDHNLVLRQGKLAVGGANAYATLHIVSNSNSNGDNTARFEAKGIGGAYSHIHYGQTGDWYIRSALSSGKVVLQDTGGGVAIGTTDTSDARLAVDGRIRAEEVVVAMSENWPDYVFEDGYELRTLGEVEAHIDEHGHLPGIPSASVIEEEGLSVGAVQTKMMEKIEEMTLYIIDQNKRMEEKDRQIESLLARVEALEAAQ